MPVFVSARSAGRTLLRYNRLVLSGPACSRGRARGPRPTFFHAIQRTTERRRAAMGTTDARPHGSARRARPRRRRPRPRPLRRRAQRLRHGPGRCASPSNAKAASTSTPSPTSPAPSRRSSTPSRRSPVVPPRGQQPGPRAHAAAPGPLRGRARQRCRSSSEPTAAPQRVHGVLVDADDDGCVVEGDDGSDETRVRRHHPGAHSLRMGPAQPRPASAHAATGARPARAQRGERMKNPEMLEALSALAIEKGISEEIMLEALAERARHRVQAHARRRRGSARRDRRRDR